MAFPVVEEKLHALTVPIVSSASGGEVSGAALWAWMVGDYTVAGPDASPHHLREREAGDGAYACELIWAHSSVGVWERVRAVWAAAAVDQIFDARDGRPVTPVKVGQDVDHLLVPLPEGVFIIS